MTKYTCVELPRTGAFPRKLFFYEHGKEIPAFKFTRQSRTTNWIGHGFYSMSREAVEKWVEDGAVPPVGRAKRPINEYVQIAEGKIRDAEERGLKKIYVTPALLRALVKKNTPGY